ncbi:Fanconi anemia core complex-associated protein 100 isoform X2 [Pseudophryne corroboree]|uniref:Fanconi anemia core complex-associated protein 100 isoform X2 n=1 Tax=Pseudophryne corroboree TaxID=495146 RepID=UPI0030816631
MAHVEHLLQFQCPSGGLSRCKAQIISWNKHIYVCNGSRFVYVFSMEKKQITLDKWKVKLFHRKSLRYEDPSTSPSRDVTFGKGTSDLEPVLCCVSLWKENTMGDVPCNFSMDAALFTRLFGVDLAILETPMILCGFPDGQVICFPLKSTGSSYMHTSETNCLRQSSLKVLYHLEQPVLSIGATRTEPCDLSAEQPITSSETVSCDCLLFIGKKGLIVPVTAGDISEGIVCDFKEYHLPGPVCCTLYTMCGVYCSTSSDLIFITIPRVAKVAASTTPSGSAVSSFRHNIPMVLAVSQNTFSSDEVAELVVLSSRGWLMLYKVNRRGSRDPLHGLGGADAGMRIKKLLSGIGSVSERVSQLKSVVDDKSRSLTKLNQVISLSREVLSSQRTECPVHCVIRVSWTHVLQKDCLMAHCIVENKTECVLERGWTLCILISTVPNTSYSFPIALKPEEKTELTFPLATNGCDSLDFPITISCTLFYSLKGLVADCGDSADSSMSYSHKQDVSIPIQEHIIDVLQCLRFSSQTDFPSCSGPSWTLPEHIVQVFLKTCSGCESSDDTSVTVPKVICNQEVNHTIPLKAIVRVSALQLTQALHNEQSGRPLCSAALHWLLSAELTKVQNLVEVQGVNPDGRKFCLRVQEVSVPDLSSDGNIPAIEVQILSSHLHAVASLHLAIINRFKILLQQNKTNNDSRFPDLNLGNIQQQYSVHELLLKEVKTLKERLCVDEDIISSTAAQRLLHIYRELRESPSLLFI